MGLAGLTGKVKEVLQITKLVTFLKHSTLQKKLSRIFVARWNVTLPQGDRKLPVGCPVAGDSTSVLLNEIRGCKSSLNANRRLYQRHLGAMQPLT